jgi:hypothetical protein
MFFAGFPPETNERLLRAAGFHVELLESREELEARCGTVRFHRVIARRLDR